MQTASSFQPRRPVVPSSGGGHALPCKSRRAGETIHGSGWVGKFRLATLLAKPTGGATLALETDLRLAGLTRPTSSSTPMEEYMELRHIKYFLTVARVRNFRRAAEVLGISQPPLSVQIRQLEEELGVTLFERTSRGTLLTRPGREFLAHAESIIEKVKVAKDAAMEAAGVQNGTLRVGCTFSSAYFYLLPKIIDDFRSVHPSAHVEITESHTIEQITKISQGDMDVGFVREPTYKIDDDMEIHKIWTEHLSLVLRRDSPLAHLDAASINDLRGIPLISYNLDRGIGLGYVLNRLCRNNGFEPNIIQIGGSITFIFGLVSAGLGAAIVPTTTKILQIETLKFIPIVNSDARCNLYMAHRSGVKDTLLREFTTIAMKSYGEG